MLQSCQSEPNTKNDASPSASPVEERINQLKIMSTPPQKWTLEIDSGQKDVLTQSYVLKDIQWNNAIWTFTSASAKQESSSDLFLFETIYGTTTPQQLRLSAHQSAFNTTQGLIKGGALSVKAHNENWEISAENYQSEYPWSTLKLYQVKGSFKR